MITLFILVNFKNEDDNLRKDIYLAFLVISLMVVAGCNVFETIYGTTSAGNPENIIFFPSIPHLVVAK